MLMMGENIILIDLFESLDRQKTNHYIIRNSKSESEKIKTAT